MSYWKPTATVDDSNQKQILSLSCRNSIAILLLVDRCSFFDRLLSLFCINSFHISLQEPLTRTMYRTCLLWYIHRGKAKWPLFGDRLPTQDKAEDVSWGPCIASQMRSVFRAGSWTETRLSKGNVEWNQLAKKGPNGSLVTGQDHHLNWVGCIAESENQSKDSAGSCFNDWCKQTLERIERVQKTVIHDQRFHLSIWLVKINCD